MKLATVANEEYLQETKEEFLGTAAHENTVGKVAYLGQCPRWVDDVYALGISLQSYISEIYFELESLSEGKQKILYRNLALSQLVAKEEIRKLADYNLNQLLAYFYNNGGPIIEPPVSEKMGHDIQPFFSRIASNFLDELDVIVKLAVKGTIDASQLDNALDNYLNAMYMTMGKLFPVPALEKAFTNMVEARQAAAEG